MKHLFLSAVIVISAFLCLCGKKDPAGLTGWEADADAVQRILDANALTNVKVSQVTSQKMINDEPRVVELNLNGTITGGKITTVPGSALAVLTEDTVLRLEGNGLTSLPTAIGSMSKLTSLNLANNQLTALPNEVTTLALLLQLKLDNNKITAIPDSMVKLTKLQGIGLDGNKICRTTVSAALDAWISARTTNYDWKLTQDSTGCH